MLKITGTFLDEISYDIPHQNWSENEWDRDFAAMKHIGIDSVYLIRAGLKRFMAFPSRVLAKSVGAYQPPVDLIEMFLRLCDKYDMDFYAGGYDGWRPWEYFEEEIAVNLDLYSEIYERYGSHRCFKGWYISKEVSRAISGIADGYARMGCHCKNISGNLPVMISPYIQGLKCEDANGSASISCEEHEREWASIFAAIDGAVDVVAFQDGHAEYDELAGYFAINRKLADRHHMACWSNCETFDRDMPIKFLPIKWEKMRLKLQAAQEAQLSKAITFEFSHFMSPWSCYGQAHGLYRRYCEAHNIPLPDGLPL